MQLIRRLFSKRQIQDEESLLNSKTFCIMPWVHFHITQYGTVTPCCQAPWQENEAFGNINTETMEQIWEGSNIKAFRKQMLNGKIDHRCLSCFERESKGMTSLRNITNKKYSHKYELVLETDKNGGIGKNKPVYFDIRFSNVCNLKCRICGPWSSSNWYNDAIKLGMISEDSKALTYSFKDAFTFWDQFNNYIDSLEEIYFAGGEPLMMDEHYKLLNLLIEKGKTNVKLTYNTNFSTLSYKTYDVVKLWEKFPNIIIAASLDASFARGEFLRKNLKWETVLQNRSILQNQLSHIEFLVSPTLNIYNLLHLPDFHQQWVESKLIRVEDFIPSFLVQPNELSITILPNSYKGKAIKRYEIHLAWILDQSFEYKEKYDYMLNQYKNILKILSIKTETDSMELFRNNSRAMDLIRDEKTLDIFPELAELF